MELEIKIDNYQVKKMFSRINIFRQQQPQEEIKLSIIIPTHNVEEHIYTCMDSIVNQGLNKTEVICIDDCSTDSTLDILKEYEEYCDNITVIENEENHGPGYSRNRGLDVATGEYVCFIDSDDWIEDFSLGYLYTLACKKDIDLLFSKIIDYDDETNDYYKTDDHSLNILREYENKIFNYHDIDSKVLYAISGTPQGKLIKRSIITNNNIRFLEDKHYEDDVFFNEVFFNSKRASIVDEYFYVHRIEKENKIEDTGRTLIDIIDVLDKLLITLLKDKTDYAHYHKVLFNYITCIIRRKFISIDAEYMNEYYNHVKDLVKKCITEYRIHEEITYNLTKNFLNDYNLCVKSIDSSNDYIKRIQSSIELNPVVSVVYDSSNHDAEKVKQVIKSVSLQSYGFIKLEVLLIDNEKNHDILTEYSDTYANIRLIDTYSVNKYLDCLKEVKTEHVIFIDNEISDDFLEKEFKYMYQDNLNLVIPGDELTTKDNDEIDFIVEKILFRTEFIDNEENFINIDGSIKLIPILYLNSSANVNLIDIFRNSLESNDTKSYNHIMDLIRTLFINIDPSKKNDYFENITEFVKIIITEYDHESFINNLDNTNKHFYELAVKSLHSDDEKITRIQEEIHLKTPVCAMVYVKNNPQKEIKDIFNSLIRQTIGFEHIKILFIDNKSRSLKTIKLLRDFNDVYANVKCIRIRSRNKTVPYAYNVGFKNTSSPYIMITNNELIFDNDAIKQMYKSIRKSDANIVIGKASDESKLPENTMYTSIIKTEFIRQNSDKFLINRDNNLIFKDDVLKLDGVIKEDILVIKNKGE